MRKLGRRRTAAPVLAAMLMATAACADTGGGHAGAPDSAAVVAGQAAYAAVVAELFGSRNDRAAAEELQFLRHQSAIAACARGRGINYTIPAFTDINVANERIVPGDMTAFAPLADDFGAAERQARIAADGEPGNAAFLALPDERARDAYLAKLEGCQNAGGESATEGHFPDGALRLQDELIDLLGAVERAGPVAEELSRYGDCLAGRGFDAKDWRELYISVENAFPPNPERPTDITTDPRWIKARDNERAAAAADRECREKIHDLAFAEAGPRLTDFRRDRSGALERIAAEWAKARADLAAVKATLAPS
jgi:hypothetical protein